MTFWIFAAAITLSAFATVVMLTSGFVALSASIAARSNCASSRRSGAAATTPRSAT